MSKLRNLVEVDEIKNIFNVWFIAIGVLLKMFMIPENLYFFISMQIVFIQHEIL